MTDLLEAEGLCVDYGGISALRGVSLRVAEGDLVCIVGPNGAGKSTAFAALVGGVHAKQGAVRYKGKLISGMKPESIARLGISMVPEGRHIFGTLSVRENLLIGGHLQTSQKSARRDMEQLFESLPILAERSALPAGRLSGGEQQMLAIARAMMTRPDFLMIDEPSLGLAPIIVTQIYEMLNTLRKDRKLTLLINEQSSKRVLSYADRIYVMRSGLIKLEDLASNLQDGQRIHDAYFGFAQSGEGGAT